MTNISRLPALVMFFSLVLLSNPAAAGQEAARIFGQVTDQSGGVLPGVTVTVTSPSLQVPETVSVTDANGEYRVTPLPIGLYQVVYTLQGFQTVRREDIRLTVGFAAKLDVAMKVGTLAETITVSGAAPVVDVTSTTATTVLTRETLELTPTSRNGIVGILAQAPGVRTNLDVGGNTLNATPSTSVFGQPGEPRNAVEGIVTSTLQQNGGNGNYWNYLTLEEVSVQTVGNDAEMATRGVQVNAIVKSGSNQFHGGGQYGRTSDTLQSNNIDDA